MANINLPYTTLDAGVYTVVETEDRIDIQKRERFEIPEPLYFRKTLEAHVEQFSKHYRQFHQLAIFGSKKTGKSTLSKLICNRHVDDGAICFHLNALPECITEIVALFKPRNVVIYLEGMSSYLPIKQLEAIDKQVFLITETTMPDHNVVVETMKPFNASSITMDCSHIDLVNEVATIQNVTLSKETHEYLLENILAAQTISTGVLGSLTEFIENLIKVSNGKTPAEIYNIMRKEHGITLLSKLTVVNTSKILDLNNQTAPIPVIRSDRLSDTVFEIMIPYYGQGTVSGVCKKNIVFDAQRFTDGEIVSVCGNYSIEAVEVYGFPFRNKDFNPQSFSIAVGIGVISQCFVLDMGKIYTMMNVFVPPPSQTFQQPGYQMPPQFNYQGRFGGYQPGQSGFSFG